MEVAEGENLGLTGVNAAQAAKIKQQEQQIANLTSRGTAVAARVLNDPPT